MKSGAAILKNDYTAQAVNRRKKKVAEKPKATDNEFKSTKGNKNGR